MNLQFLLSAAPDYTQPLANWGDRVSMALNMVLRGIGTVFFVLALLWGILAIFSKVIHRDQPKEITLKPVPAKKATPAPAPVAPAPAPAPQTDDAALVAAITAAVAAYLDQSPTSFRVVSFKRTGKKK